jgi:DNA mismatch repair protein MutS2
MKYKIGDRVRVGSGRRDGVIEEIRSDGKVRVRIGSLAVVCNAEALAPPRLQVDHRVDAAASPVQFLGDRPSPTRFEKPLDLHGLRANEAISQLATYIDAALLSGVDRVEVIHGIGSGAVMESVHAWLRSCGSVQSFRRAVNNPGSTWVYF